MAAGRFEPNHSEAGPSLRQTLVPRLPRALQVVHDNVYTTGRLSLNRDLILATNTSAPEGRTSLDYVAEDFDRIYRGKRILVIDFSGRNHPHQDPYEPKSGKDFENAAKLAEAKLEQFGPDKFVHLHREDDPLDAIAQAQAFYVAGGNTSGHTANLLGYKNFDGNPIDIVKGSNSKPLQYALRLKVADGTPYAGVSAGQMIATANGIPHIDPPAHIHIERSWTGEIRVSMPYTGLNFLGNLGLAIQPHYEPEKPTYYGDESQYHRLEQVIERNPWLTIIGMENNTALKVQGKSMTLVGDPNAHAYIIRFEPYLSKVNAIGARMGADLSRLLDTDISNPPQARFRR
jgi:peptidase E